MNCNRIWCFGDSWGYGSELNLVRGEMPFAGILAKKFNCDLENLSKSGMSLGLITRTISMSLTDILPDDLVLVVIPPDSRWYTEWRTLSYSSSKDFFSDKTDQWFQYHHQLFVFAICEMLDKTKCNYLLMHNYGNFPLLESPYCFPAYHQDRFLDKQSLTAILTNTVNDSMMPIEVEISHKTKPYSIFFGPYFQGCQCHPNQLGHQFIADKIQSKLHMMQYHDERHRSQDRGVTNAN